MLKNELESRPQAETHGPLSELKYLRPAQVPRRYPFSRSILYELLAAGKIESVSVRKPGGVRGIRLVSVASIEAFLAKLVAEQKDEKLCRSSQGSLLKRRSQRGGKRLTAALEGGTA